MPAWLISAIRTAIQAAWPSVAAALAVAHIPATTEVPEWVAVAVFTGAVAVWTAVVRRLEAGGPFAVKLASVLMLGVTRTPVYTSTGDSERSLR